MENFYDKYLRKWIESSVEKINYIYDKSKDENIEKDITEEENGKKISKTVLMDFKGWKIIRAVGENIDDNYDIEISYVN